MLKTDEITILIDCGLQQGSDSEPEINAAPFAYDPKQVDVLLVTHAHADHIGRIAKLVKDGFRGVIYSTPPTKALAGVMMQDAYKVMTEERKRYGTPVWYGKEDIETALSLWKTTGYQEWRSLSANIDAQFTNAGHILGSAMVHLRRNGRTLVCTGDVGNVPQPLMSPPTVPQDYHYLIMESVYGDRVHEEVEERSALLLHEIERVRKTGGTLLLPAFSLERTQSMLFEINNFIESGRIEPIPVFLDSPLAIEVTDIYRRYTHYLNQEVQERMNTDPDIFDFPGFLNTHSVEDSRQIQKEQGAKIIIAGSGMSHGGRIRTHEKTYLQDKDSTLLLVGHQVVGSLGRKLQDGAKKVTIDGVDVSVKARVKTIRGYSGHADRDQLIDLVAGGGDKAEQVFVTMGEEKSSLFLVQRLHDYLGLNAITPEKEEVAEIDF